MKKIFLIFSILVWQFTSYTQVPTISGFAPDSGPIGTTVNITGTNFDAIPANNIVKFNDTPAIVMASTATSITATVPAGATAGPISVMVGTTTVGSATSFNVSYVLNWADWISGTAGVASTATGVLNTIDGTIDINYSGEIAFIQTGTGTNYFSPSGAYVGALITNPPPAAEMIALSKSSSKTMAFSKPVNNLFFAVLTLNGNGYRFNNDFEIVSQGAGYWGNGTLTKQDLGNGQFQLNGTGEPHGVIRFIGAVSSISWTSLTDEFWNGFTVGTFGTAGQPTITDLSPLCGLIGTSVTVTGTNFDPTPTNNIVSFNGTPAVVTSSTATTITTSVPSGSTTGPITIKLGVNEGASSTFFVGLPGFTSFTPVSGMIGITVTITGANFTGATDVSFNGTPATSFNVVSSTSITATVPTGASTGNISVAVGCNIVTSANKITIELGGNIKVYNALSLNGDGKNEFLTIQYIDILPETQSNKVFIYNRWGDEVFSVNDYNNEDRVFKGDSKNGSKLPTGTYFYKIVFPNGKKTLTGFLELKY